MTDATPNVASATNPNPSAGSDPVAPQPGANLADAARPDAGGNADAAANPATQAADVATATDAQRQAARLELAKLDPNTEVVLTINGKERTVTVAEALRIVQTPIAADEKFKAAKQAARAAEEREARAMRALQDPETAWDTLLELGYDPAQFAEQMMQRRLAEAQMTPEQRELRELRRQQALQEQYRREYEAQQQQQLAARHEAMYRSAFDAAMTDAGLPANPALRARLMPDLAAAVAEAVEVGTRLNRSQLAELARQAYRPIRDAALSSLAPDERRAFYGSNLDELRAFLATVAEQPSAAPTEQPTEPQPVAKPPIPGVRSEPVRDDSGRFQAPRRPQYRMQGSLEAFRRGLGR